MVAQPGEVVPAAPLGGAARVRVAARVEWWRLGELLTSPSALAALGLSLRTSATATLICLLLGVPLALVLARADFPGREVVRSLVLLPLVLPPVVGGVALLYTFGRRGLLGHSLEVLGLPVAFSTTWLFVRIKPSRLTMIPLPADSVTCFPRANSLRQVCHSLLNPKA